MEKLFDVAMVSALLALIVVVVALVRRVRKHERVFRLITGSLKFVSEEMTAIKDAIDPEMRVKAIDGGRDSFTCFVCEKTSYNPEDVAQQYCGSCKDFTGGIVFHAKKP